MIVFRPIGITTLYFKYILYDDSIEVVSGIFFKKTDNVFFNKITDATLEQSPLQRLLGLGNITLHTHDDTNKLIILRDVPNPNILFKHIKSKIKVNKISQVIRE